MRAETLKSLLSYDPETGHFVWVSRGRERGPSLEGHRAGTLGARGYIAIRIQGERHYAHRLAWLYMTGEMPTGQIDHANGDRSDNRWANLREASISQNRVNRAPRNRSGLPRGVVKRGDTFSARIQHNGEQVWIGTFGTVEEAQSAYEAEAKRRFGEFLTERALQVEHRGSDA